MTIYFKGPFSISRNEILINFARIVWRVLCKNAPKHVLILPTRSNNCFKSIFSALLCKHFHVLANCQTICVSLLTTATNIALGSFDSTGCFESTVCTKHHEMMFWPKFIAFCACCESRIALRTLLRTLRVTEKGACPQFFYLNFSFIAWETLLSCLLIIPCQKGVIPVCFPTKIISVSSTFSPASLVDTRWLDAILS